MSRRPIIAVIQARMGSTRLPGKVLAELGGAPLLERMVDRAAKSTLLDGICIATSDRLEDRRVLELAQRIGVDAYVGSENDVLDRMVKAARQQGASTVVRLTGDCPLLDPQVIDKAVGLFLDGEWDYVSNTLLPTYPDGLDVEVVSMEALETALREALLPSEREHVTPFIKNRPERFRLHNFRHERDLSHLRFTVDAPEDLLFVRTLYARLANEMVPLSEMLDILDQEPGLLVVNQAYKRDEGYAKSLKEDDMKKAQAAACTGQTLYEEAKRLIPGGTQLLSKRPEMFLPDHWPSYYAKASGVEITDLDGNVYYDMSYQGLGACSLGAANQVVDAAVLEAVRRGNMSTLNCPEEVELARELVRLHPWAGMVRFARCGGEAMAQAVRIARAATGRDVVAFCGYHGWHDWYLAANISSQDSLIGHLLPGLQPAGVPKALAGTALPFRYNDVLDLKDLVSREKGRIGAIVMEPVRNIMPEPGFLEAVRTIASEIGAPLVFDEVSAGFRLVTGGAHLALGVAPDIAVFAKALGNGYPMAAVIGRPEFMEAAQKSFISSTYWTDRIGPVAALAVIREYERLDVPVHLDAMGRLAQSAWRDAGTVHAIPVSLSGITPLSGFQFDVSDKQGAHTLYTQLMLDRGFLATKGFYACLAHTTEILARFREAVFEVFGIVAKASRDGNIEAMLRGPKAHTGFKRLT